MAFKSSRTAPSVSAPAPAPSSVQGVLVPDPARTAEVEARGPAVMESAGQAAHTQALRTMNAVRTLAPLLSAAVAGGGNDRDQASRFSELLAQSNRLAKAALRALEYDPEIDRNRWMVNVLERALAETVATGVHLSPELVAEFAARLPERASELPQMTDMSKDASLAVSMFQAMLPVIGAQQKFDFFRNRENDLQAARDLLLDEVVKTMEALAPPLAGEAERTTMFGLLCQEAGRSLEQAWLWGASQAREALSRKTRDEVAAWRKANREGFPIDPVHARFRETMHRLRLMAKPPR